MKTVLLWGVVIFIVLVGGFFFFNNVMYSEKQTDTSMPETHAYRCPDGTEFSISFREDMSEVRFMPIKEVEFSINETTLTRVPSEFGVRFDGNGISIQGEKKTVLLVVNNDVVPCFPILKSGEEPYLFQ